MRSTSSAADRRVAGTECGATVVEFLGVMLLATVALMVLMQAALWIWARNVTMNAADEGARVAAESGRPLGDGAARVRSVLHDGLGVRASAFAVEVAQDGDTVVVRTRGRAPQIVPFLAPLDVSAEARAFDEDEALPGG